MIKAITLVLFAAILLGVLLGLNRQAYPVLADDLVFQRIDGLQQPFQTFKGKPLLVTFWSPSCALCMREVDELNRLYREHQGDSGFELLALSMYYDRPDWVIETSRRMGMRYPVYFDLEKTLSAAFGNVVATPTTFLLNADGNVVYRHVGRLDFSLIEQKLSQLTG